MFRLATFADDTVKPSGLVLLAALVDAKENEDDDNDCDDAQANSKNHHYIVASFLFFNFRLRNGCNGFWLRLRLRSWIRFFDAVDGRTGRVHGNNSKLYNTAIVFDAMDSDPLLRWTKLVSLRHLGLSWYDVTEFIDSGIVGKFYVLDTIDLGILNFIILDFTVESYFLTITIFEANCIQLVMQGSFVSFIFICDRWVVRGLEEERDRSQISRSPREASFEGRNAMLERHLVNVHQLIPIADIDASSGRTIRW